MSRRRAMQTVVAPAVLGAALAPGRARAAAQVGILNSPVTWERAFDFLFDERRH